MDDLRIGVGRGEFAPNVGARPIDLRAIAFENLAPINRFPGDERPPVRHLFGILHHFFHMVTGPKAQHLERALQRRRARSAEAGSNDR